MELRDILVLFRAGHDERAVFAVAGDLASEYRAFLRALYLEPAPVPAVADGFAMDPDAISAMADRLDAEARRSAHDARTAFTSALETCGANGGFTILPVSCALAEAPIQARMADLVVAARPHDDDPGFAKLVDHILAESGAPCLLVPETAQSGMRFRRILIAWNGTRQARRAVDEAMPLLREAELIEAVVIGDPPGVPSPDDDYALSIHLARHGIATEVSHIPADGEIGDVLLDKAQSFGADLLVMGAYGHGRTRKILSGRVSRTIFRNASLPVLISC